MKIQASDQAKWKIYEYVKTILFNYNTIREQMHT